MSDADHVGRDVAATETGRLERAFAAFDRANAKDPMVEEVDSTEIPRELAYAHRMSTWLQRLYPDASDDLQLAARCQHIERWTHPRSDYPVGRIGYLKWRHNLKAYHAKRAGEILRELGYSENTISRVGALVRKERLKQDAETQALEDVACLVFLDHYFAAFAASQDRGKIIKVLQKTWGKMSQHAHKAALDLPFSQDLQSVISEALSEVV